MNDQEKWVSLLQSIEEVADDLQRYPPQDDELEQVRQADRDLRDIRWDCEDNERKKVSQRAERE